jgi:hypothetical protein
VGILASAGAGPAPGGEHQTIYVAASGKGDGSGLSSPFVLRAGREYALDRLIRHATDAGSDVEVVFDDGIYRDVRLQILKQGVDTDSVYMLEPGADAAGHAVRVAGQPYHYFSSARCNQEGMNCRVKPEDYSLGPKTNAAVALVAEHPHRAIFDGASFQLANPEVDNAGLVIAGAYFGVTQAGRSRIRSEPIENVSVTGLVFRNYRNGILVQHALGITIDNCLVENIGTHGRKPLDDQRVGVSGFTANGDSQLVLVRDTTIRNVWNLQGSTRSSEAWPGLMHSVYDGDSRDIIFIDDTFAGSSGPMLKFGYYPAVTDQRVIYQYGSRTWERRGFFIGNRFILLPIIEGGHPLPPYWAMQAFIHDNSEALAGGSVTPPAKGMVFINNLFRNALSKENGRVVAFLRQELPVRGTRPEFPGFVFAGNRIEGVAPDQLVVHRYRGSEVADASIDRDDPAHLQPPLSELIHQTGAPVDVEETIGKLLGGPLRSPDAARDRLVEFVIRTGRMPRVK